MKLLCLTLGFLGSFIFVAAAQPSAGTYNGLFFETNRIAPESSGSVVITVRAGGAFSGKLQPGNTRISFSGRFDNSGRTNLMVYPKGLSPFRLELDGSRESNYISGSVSDGNWTATLLANRAQFDGITSPAPQAGSYTFLVSGKEGSATEPAGDGFGTLTVNTAGKIKLMGSLADGTRISQSSAVGPNGDWPLYVSLYSGKGSVLSWLTFNNQPGSDFGGDLRWIKPASVKTRLYPAGFTNQTTVNGSSYHRPSSDTCILDITNGTVLLTGGNLSESICSHVILDANNCVRNLDSNHLKLTFTLPSGAFRGTVQHPTASKPVSFNGVVLQKGNVASGYFAGASQSGTVRLIPTAEYTVQIKTTGSSFAPEVQVFGTPENFLWSWSDHTMSTNYPVALKDFGSVAARKQYLSVTPSESVTAINLGFDATDGGETLPLSIRPPQNVSAVSFNAPLKGLQYWASSYNPITDGLDFTGFTSLLDVECLHCPNLKRIGVTNLPSLKRLCLEDCGLEELDLSGDPALEDVRVALNAFTNIIVGNGTGPNILHWCTRNIPNLTQNFQTMMTNFHSLRELLIWDNNQHGMLAPISPNLTDVMANDNYYTAVDFTGQIHLQTCWLQNNNLTNLVLTGCTGLIYLDAHNNQLTTPALDQILLDLLSAPYLESVNLTNNTQLPSALGYASYSILTNRGVTVLLDWPP